MDDESIRELTEAKKAFLAYLVAVHAILNELDMHDDEDRAKQLPDGFKNFLARQK